jgi:hypothetical protein
LTLHVGGIDDWSTCVVSDLEAPPVIPRNAIEDVLAVINPNWQLFFDEAQVACGSAEEEHLLTSRSDDWRKNEKTLPSQGPQAKIYESAFRGSPDVTVIACMRLPATGPGLAFVW